MGKNRLKNLVTIFVCGILIIITFIFKLTNEKKVMKELDNIGASPYANENQLEQMDDSLYDENATDN